MVWREYGAILARRELAATVSAVKTITIYDIAAFGVGLSSNDLSSAVSAQFPVEVFTNAAASAEYHNTLLFEVYKESSLAVFTLRDGSQRRACFHYYDGSFELKGMPGSYVVPGGRSSQFNATLMHLVRELLNLRANQGTRDANKK